MVRSCNARRHSPHGRIARNQGFEFARCRHCGSDLIRSAGIWKAAPNGFRVVWRASDSERTEDPARLRLDLDPGSRDLVVGGSSDGVLRRLAGLIGLATTGLSYLVLSASDQLLGAWQRFAAWKPRRKMLRLPAA